MTEPAAAICQAPISESASTSVGAPPLLHFSEVSKWYGPVIGVNEVSLTLDGGITGLVGANGAGKTTLLRLATGHLKPDIGQVRVRGLDAWDWRAKRLVGFCPETDAFYEEMPGTKFVEAMARLCGYTRTEARDRTAEAIARVGMAGRADRRIRSYSKGMRQRIKLAAGLIHNPAMLILDEPLSGIDPVGRREMLELFKVLAEQGTGVLVSSHELEELEKLTDHIAVMARGRVVAVGTLAHIRELFDDLPLSVRVVATHPRGLAARLVRATEVAGLDLAMDGSLVVRARQPRRFFSLMTQLTVVEGFDVTELEPIDDTAHAILGYLLGGSGKT